MLKRTRWAGCGVYSRICRYGWSAPKAVRLDIELLSLLYIFSVVDVDLTTGPQMKFICCRYTIIGPEWP